MPGARSPGRVNFVRWRMIFLANSVLNLLYATILAAGILKWILDL